MKVVCVALLATFLPAVLVSSMQDGDKSELRKITEQVLTRGPLVSHP